MRSSKMQVFSFGRYIFRVKFPTGFTYRNLHGFTRFPCNSTALVRISCIFFEDEASDEGSSFSSESATSENVMTIHNYIIDATRKFTACQVTEVQDVHTQTEVSPCLYYGLLCVMRCSFTQPLSGRRRMRICFADVFFVFFWFFCFCFFPSAKNLRQPFSGTAERIFMKLLPNDTYGVSISRHTEYRR